MTPWIRHSLQTMIVGCGVSAVATAWILVLAFTDRAAIAGWPLIILVFGMLLVAGGVISAEIANRRQRP